MRQIKYKATAWFVILNVLLALSSCKKFVDIEPPVTSTTGSSVFLHNSTAIAVLTGIYIRLSEGNDFATGNFSFSVLCGLSADELDLYQGISSTDSKVFYHANSLFANPTVSSPGTESWSQLYYYIFVCNDAIESLNKSNSLNSAVKQQLLGEAKFIRSFCYFYLVNLYGNVPLVTSTDYSINSKIPNTHKSEVYEQIINDLLDAKEWLSTNYLDGSLLKSSTERVRPTKWAAAALLARVYLYMGNYIEAEVNASEVITNTTLFNLTSPLINVFLKNSDEAIWQLQPVNMGWNTEDARVFVLKGEPSSGNPVYLNHFLTKSFDSADLRRQDWIQDTVINSVIYSYPYKYKLATNGEPLSEYLMVMRVAEQYLIRAEARAQQNKISEGSSDLNAIRVRAGLNVTSASNKESLLAAILEERRYELFTEWGHRWLDLKRTGNIDDVMAIATPNKAGAPWKPYQHLYPVPADQILLNRQMVQNPGY